MDSFYFGWDALGAKVDLPSTPTDISQRWVITDLDHMETKQEFHPFSCAESLTEG